MGKAKRTVLAAACAAALVVGSVAATVAYLTSTDTVTNTFTVGNVEIALDEALVNEMGQPIQSEENQTVVDKDEAPRVAGNDYKLIPGHSYVKDPTVHVDEDSEGCYLFVKVENGISAIEDSTGTVASQMASKGWKAVDGQAGLYVYVGTAENASAPLAVSANANVTVFEKVEVASTVAGTTLNGYANKTVTVTAYAVQKDGFEGQSASQIWAAAFPATGGSSDDEATA